MERLSPKQLERYRDKALRRIIKYAYDVPLYHKKYKKAGIRPSDIRGINDIKKIPFISKQDLIDNFPDSIVPVNYNRAKSYVVCTGGTSGKPVSIYTDFPTMLRSIGPILVQMQYFHLNLRKIRLAHIGNFNRYRIDSIVEQHFLPELQHFYSLKNTLNIDVNEPVTSIMNRLNVFKPDLIISYPALFQYLAFLKRKGFGENVQPTLLQVGGDILDEYTRRYVQDAFGCPMLNIYPSVEAQACIAFECQEKRWHIHSDFFHVEAVDSEMNLVSPGERGRIVLTRLWGRGTPIVRYTGMEDWVTLGDRDYCSCRLRNPIFKKPVEGRIKANIVLPSGKVFPPGAFCFIEPVLHDLKTFKVKQYQVVQKKIDEIEILLVIDEELRHIGASVDEIAEGVKKIYQEKTEPGVTVTVREVEEIKGDPNSGKPAPIVVSNVKPEEVYKILDKH